MSTPAEPTETEPTGAPRRADSALSAVSGPLGIALTVALIAAWMLRPAPTPAQPPKPADPEPKVVAAPAPPPPPETIEVAFVGPPRPVVDETAVALAQARREVAERRKAEAEAAEVVAARQLEDSRAEADQRAADAKAEADRLGLPRARIAQVSANLEQMRARREGLDRVIVQLDGQPPPRVSLDQAARTTKSPVARQVQGEEYHFEVRGDRITFIDLQRLLKMAEEDARLRIRMMGSSRLITAHVGPVGSFRMKYELGRSPLGALNELVQPGSGGAFTLVGFEVEPVQRLRGDTIESAQNPASEFARVLNRVRPGRATFTLWVYPDGFGLYRQVSELLSSRGYFVAARPLPADVPVRGSPAGSRSAAQ